VGTVEVENARNQKHCVMLECRLACRQWALDLAMNTLTPGTRLGSLTRTKICQSVVLLSQRM